MAICARCKFKRDSEKTVVGYGTLPEYRCTRNPATGQALAGGKSVPAIHAKHDRAALSVSKIGRGDKCGNMKIAAAMLDDL